MEINYLDYLKYLKYDFRRYRSTGASSFWKVLTYQGFWAIIIFRICSYMYYATRSIPVIRSIISLFCLFNLRIIQILTGISLPVGAKIGPGFYIGHYGLILLNAGLKIGSNCNISPHTWIGGWGGPGIDIKHPIIGDRVWIGPDVKILKPIKVGNDAVVGMNSIVFNDVPDRAFVAGNPAKVIDYRGSFDLIFYDGMESDEERLKSMAFASRVRQSANEVVGGNKKSGTRSE